jgi:2-haloacid dehalogenase
MPIDALVFDAYGTLFDVHSVVVRCEEIWPGKGSTLTPLWRAKQLEYTWLRSLMGRYADFETVTREALRHTCETLDLACTDADVAALMEAYRHLDPYPEVVDFLRTLAGRRRSILSNGSPPMLDAVVANSGLAEEFDMVLSVDAIGIYKPDPRVYQLAVDRLGVDHSRIGFVSSNCWDACGAQSFGFNAFWINRGGAPTDALGATPARTLGALNELSAWLD